MIIALTAPAYSGKSTIAEVLVQQHAFVRVSFAKPLKDMLLALGLTEAQVYGDQKDAPCDLLCGRTPRWAMQSLGTEWGRKLVGSDLWVNAAMQHVDALLAAHRDVVIDDLRFDNEARALAKRNACMLLVHRDGVKATSAHVSEQGIPNTWLSGRIQNDGTPEDAACRVINFAEARRMQGKHDL